MTSPSRDPRWTRTGLPSSGRVDLLPRGEDAPLLEVPGGPEPLVPLVWLGDVSGDPPDGAVTALAGVCAGWNLVPGRVAGVEVWDTRPVLWEPPRAGWLVRGEGLPALRAAVLGALVPVCAVPEQPGPWRALVPTGEAWFPLGSSPEPSGVVVFDRVRLSWGPSRAWVFPLLG